MNLAQYVEGLRQELLVAAEAGGDDARVLAERLTAPLESATRLMLLEVLSAAADEITSDLAPGSVDLRLRGRDPEFVVTSPGRQAAPDDAIGREPVAGPPTPAVDGEDGAPARLTLRLPEYLKLRLEAAAARDGLSVNSWLVQAVSDSLESGLRDRRPAERRAAAAGKHFTGWAR